MRLIRKNTCVGRLRALLDEVDTTGPWASAL